MIICLLSWIWSAIESQRLIHIYIRDSHNFCYLFFFSNLFAFGWSDAGAFHIKNFNENWNQTWDWNEEEWNGVKHFHRNKMILLFEFIGWNDIYCSLIRLDNEHFECDKKGGRENQSFDPGLAEISSIFSHRVVFKDRPKNFFFFISMWKKKTTSQLNIRHILGLLWKFRASTSFLFDFVMYCVLRSVKIARESNSRCWRMSFIWWAIQCKTTPKPFVLCTYHQSLGKNVLFTISLILDFTDLVHIYI